MSTVPARRFVVLCLASFGLYELVWFYRAWRWIAQKKGLDVRPAWRAFLAPVYSFSLFDRIFSLAYEKGLPVFRYPQVFSVLYLPFIAARLRAPLSKTALLAFLPLLPAVSVLNSCLKKDDPAAAAPRGWSRGELALLAVAAPIWILRIVWEFLPE